MRLAVLLAPAILLLAACGGGGGSGGSDATATLAPNRTAAADLPAPVPDGTIAVSRFHIFRAAGLQTTLLTLPLTQAVPEGYKTSWYTYKDGAWVALQPAVVVGGNAPTAQNAFAPVPENVIVLAEPE